MTAEQAKALGFSRTKLYNDVLESRNRAQPDSQDQEPESTASSMTESKKIPTSETVNSSASKDRTGTEPTSVIDDSDRSEDALSDEADGLDLEFAYIGIPELKGMILKKESFKALRRLVLANTRPRKAMSAAKMHLPSRLARTDKTLESCVDQAYLAIARHYKALCEKNLKPSLVLPSCCCR